MDTPDELLRRATAGDAHACLHMGKRLMRGRSSTARNFEEAVEWFDRAARAGLPDARYWLGKCYLKGLGCLRDPAGGVSCLEQACSGGPAAGALFRKRPGCPQKRRAGGLVVPQSPSTRGTARHGTASALGQGLSTATAHMHAKKDCAPGCTGVYFPQP